MSQMAAFNCKMWNRYPTQPAFFLTLALAVKDRRRASEPIDQGISAASFGLM